MRVLERIGSYVVRPPHRWGRLAVLLVPFAVLGAWLKVLRVRAFYPEADAVAMATQLSSDVAFGLAWGLSWALLAWHGPSWARTLAFYLAHLTTLVLAVFQVVNHEYMIRTGAPFGWEQLAYAWHGQAELQGLVEAELTDSARYLFAWVVVSTTLLPTLLGPLLARALRVRPGPSVRRLAAAASALLILGSAWSAPTASASFALAGPVRLVMGPVREAGAYPSSPATSVVLDPAATLAEASAQHRNLVVIVLESQRDSSTLPPTRYPVTPVLDALAEQSIRPERGYAVLPHTSKSITGVHCGVVPPPDMQNSEADPDGVPVPCLAELLGEQGYRSVFLQSATETFERRRATVGNLGFERFIPLEEMDSTGFHSANYFGYEDDIMLGPAREWLSQHSGQPFLMSMLTVTAHHDYNLQGYEPIDFVDDELLNRYLQGLHYQDRFVGHVLDLFRELGLYEDTVFVITGDHGEGFGEHRLYQHDNTIYDEGIRIPLLIHDPARAGEVIAGPANQLALLPTALDAIGFELDSVGTYQPSLLSDEPQGPIVATCYVRARCTATLEGDLKLVHHFGDRRDEVFDLAADNYERADIVTEVDGGWVAQQRAYAVDWYAAWEQAYAASRAG